MFYLFCQTIFIGNVSILNKKIIGNVSKSSLLYYSILLDLYFVNSSKINFSSFLSFFYEAT